MESAVDAPPTDGSDIPSHASRHDTTSPSHTPPAPISLEKIGRFRILKELGAGAFGRVYLAHHDVLDRSVALKVMRPGVGMLASAATIELMLNEARTAASIRHPGIVEVYDADWDDALELGYIAMEYVAGGTLQTRLSGRLDRDAVVDLIATTAEAVHHAHRAQCVHRDLKPGNILLDAEGRPKVADFGLALRSDDEELHRGEFAGSLPYMSPEQVRGEAHRLDGRSDVWSLGVIAYELLCGRRPFTGAPDSIVDQILHRPARPPRQFTDSVDRELQAVILRCLKKNVDLRFDTAQDLADALRALQHTRAAAADRRAFKWQRASRRFLLLALSVAAIFGAWRLSRRFDRVKSVDSGASAGGSAPPAITPAELEDALYHHYMTSHLPTVRAEFASSKGILELIDKAKQKSGKASLELLDACDFADAAHEDFRFKEAKDRPSLKGQRLPAAMGSGETGLNEWISSIEDMPLRLPGCRDETGERSVDWWLMYLGIYKGLRHPLVVSVYSEKSLEAIRSPDDDLIVGAVDVIAKAQMKGLYSDNAELLAQWIADEYRRILDSGEFDKEACRQRVVKRLEAQLSNLMSAD